MKNRKNAHRELFFAVAGLGPYTCFECGDLVHFEDVVVHHVDHDHDNNALDNLVPGHHGCHQKYHARARIGANRGKYNWTYEFTEEHRQRISEAKKGVPLSASHKEKLSQVASGKIRSDEYREQMRQRMIGRTFSDETKQRMREAAQRRWARQKENAKNE